MTLKISFIKGPDIRGLSLMLFIHSSEGNAKILSLNVPVYSSIGWQVKCKYSISWLGAKFYTCHIDLACINMHDYTNLLYYEFVCS